MQFGTAFWPIPTVTAVGSTVAKDLGDATAATWYVTSFVLAVCISFMTCGANSDLFGRRNFILLGNVLTFVSWSSPGLIWYLHDYRLINFIRRSGMSFAQLQNRPTPLSLE